MALVLMGVVWTASGIADRRSKMIEKLENKAVDWFVATGEVGIFGCLHITFLRLAHVGLCISEDVLR